jgi:Cd2+/Zn2+-exporting ATPase
MEKKLSFHVVGLDCAEEIKILRKAVETREGIKDLTFDVLNAKMTVIFDPGHVTAQHVIDWVKGAGMQASVWEERKKGEPKSFWEKHGRLMMATFSGLFLLLGFSLHIFFHPNVLDILGEVDETTHSLPISVILFYLISMIFGAFYFVPKAFLAVKRMQPDMNLLMVIAMCGAMGIGQWFEGATVAFLFSVALLLEHWSVGRARRAVEALMDLSPTQARMITDTGLKEVHVEDVEVGTRILIRPGEKVPLDATIEKGSTSINQAPITGESIPVVKEEGDEIFAGTINEEGAIECITIKKAGDTTLARIIHLVEEAQSRRASSEQWVEKFARIYTPIMIVLAIIIALIPPLFFGLSWETWFYRALVILVIACPCALVISTPVSIVSGLTSSARNGVLIKGGMYLEAPGKLDILAVDKTGTLTYGRPKVQKIIPLNNHTEEELLLRAAALEAPSEHPLARAILKLAEERNIRFERATDFQIIKGKGAQGTYNGTRYWIGSHRFMHEMNQETEEIHRMALELEDAGHSIIAIGNDKHVCGLISVADEPRAEIQSIIEDIRRAGVKHVAMLTGDNAPAAAAIAKLTGVDSVQSELLPEDKVEAVEKLKDRGKIVAMIGDGVNDAPAMAAADFGIAMGAMGTDAAIETADIALMSDDLTKVPWLIRHSRRVLHVIKQNITFSLAVKVVFLSLAIVGMATLWMAIAADAGASLLVVFNGLRLLKR